MRKAGRKPGPDRITPNPNHRYCTCGGANRLRDRVGRGDDQVRVPADDLANEITIALGPPLAGIALDR